MPVVRLPGMPMPGMPMPGMPMPGMPMPVAQLPGTLIPGYRKDRQWLQGNPGRSQEANRPSIPPRAGATPGD